MVIASTDSRAIIESLGLRPVINAMGAPSRLGCTVLSPAVRAAMDAASQHCLPIAEIAHKHGVPVLVDGAGVGGPPANLRRLIEQGADILAVSGGKSIAGPAASGVLAGRRDLIRAATLQQQDMFIYPDLWRVPLSS